ncbi:hypothetical protein [Sporosarcina sp. 6E9]|nr:hypothetical protein [Sporosarcina sp. 6E9]
MVQFYTRAAEKPKAKGKTMGTNLSGGFMIIQYVSFIVLKKR